MQRLYAMPHTLGIIARDVNGERQGEISLAVSRTMPLRIALVSLALLVPCFWQPQIEAGDLASHIYNAWLVQLIHRGEAPGLSIASRSTNVLFDFMLDGLIARVGAVWAQRVAVGICVLVFFWAAFAVVSRMARKPPWCVSPLLAILAYGTVFNMGLFNYYLGGGLSLAALAMLWQPTFWGCLVGVLFFGLAWLAQPLPVLWALGLLTYVYLARRLPPRLGPWLFAIATVSLAGMAALLLHWGSVWTRGQLTHITGADQSYLLGHHFHLVSVGVVALWIVAFLQLARNLGWKRLIALIPFQLYLLCLIGGCLLPFTLKLPWYQAAFGGVTERIAWLSAVLVCAMVAQVNNPKWYGGVAFLLALVYFSLLYADDRRMNRLEQGVESLVSTLPTGARVVGELYYPPVNGFDESMMIDRACLGHCFSFSNYEAATGEFRVRAEAGNSFVGWTMHPERRLYSRASEFFSVDPDGSLYQIYPCGADAADACMRTLTRKDLSWSASSRTAQNATK
jgi:hypothetical protein